MDVGIRDLRTHLSRYLAEVREGHEITVTAHGKAVARLVPVGERKIDELIRLGLVQRARQPKRSLPKTRIRAKGSVSELVAEQRR